MPSQIILISDKTSEVEKAESFACDNRCLFSVYTPEEWGSRSDEAFLFHNEESSQRAVPLPSGRRPVFSLEEIEAYVIEKALVACGGNTSKAARLLRIGRATLYRKMEKADIQIERFRPLEELAEDNQPKAPVVISLEEERRKRKSGKKKKKSARAASKRVAVQLNGSGRRRTNSGSSIRRFAAGGGKSGSWRRGGKKSKGGGAPPLKKAG